MDIRIDENGTPNVAVATGSVAEIATAGDALDLLGNVSYAHSCQDIVVEKALLSEDFFELRTGLAGEILQKFSNYSARLAIAGDFSGYDSKSLRDFMRESNRGNRVFFVSTMEEGIQKLRAAGAGK